MTPVATSAPPLQTLSEAAAAAWLIQWSGVVGLAASRAAAGHTQERRPPHDNKCIAVGRPIPTTARGGLRMPGSKQNAVPGHRGIQEGRTTPRSGRRGGLTLRYEATHPAGAAPTPPLGPAPARRSHDADPSRDVPQESERLSGAPVTPSSIPAAMDEAAVRHNVRRCSAYLKAQLPPLLLEGVLDTAWRALSEEVTLGGREASVAEHQVGAWARRTPALMALAASLSSVKFPLDLTGLGPGALRDAVAHVEKHFPVERLSALLLPMKKGERGGPGCLLAGAVFSRLLHGSALVKLALNLDVVGGSVLKELSELSLQELDLCGGRQSEAQVLQELCGLPFTAASQVVEAVQGDHLGAMPVTPLRQSLRRLGVSLPSLPSTVYQVLLAVFPSLQHYSPPSGAAACVSAYARMVGPHDGAKTLGLLSLNLGRASRHEILEAARLCPALREVSLSIDLECEGPLAALRTCERLSGVQLAYYPAFVSAPPKVEGSVLLPLLEALAPQLLSLGLTGFSLGGGVVAALAGLPELRRLALTDSWLSRPAVTPCHSFSSLETLALNFLPPQDVVQLLTAGACLQSLDIDTLASEGRGNGLTDASVRHLVTSGAVRSIHNFSSSSPFLTLTSLRSLASLPRVKSVGRLARWGLTQEELRCVGHSGPPHVLCHH